MHLTGNKKKRELFAESAGISVGVRTNVSHTIPFTSGRLSSGRYRVTLKAPLKAGEYAFVGPTRQAGNGNPLDPRLRSRISSTLVWTCGSHEVARRAFTLRDDAYATLVR